MLADGIPPIGPTLHFRDSFPTVTPFSCTTDYGGQSAVDNQTNDCLEAGEIDLQIFRWKIMSKKRLDLARRQGVSQLESQNSFS